MLKPREIPIVAVEAVRCAFHDNVFILARAASYSAALALFPGLIVAAAVLFRRNASQTIFDLTIAMGEVLPPSVHQLLTSYLEISDQRSGTVLTIAGVLAFLFWADLIATWMEGFRAAYRVPRRSSLWKDYGVAIGLVFLSILPMSAANLSLILSRQIEIVITRRLGPQWWLVESSKLRWWIVAWLTFTVILAVLYYVAPNRRQRWRDVWQGAALAASAWAPTTALFTFYVQNLARYREFYGGIWAVIVLLIWTYLASVFVLFGAEFNATRERRLGTLRPRSPGAG